MDSPLAMISYSWKDASAAELLHDELTLRAFRVLHDRYSFTEGSRIQTSMATAVAGCDVFIAYLTPHSLYLEAEPTDPRPALVGELRPALERRRTNLTPGRPDQPIIIPIAHGLGDRSEATTKLRVHTGEDFGSLWSDWVHQDTDYITQAEAARVADNALRALVQRDGTASPLTIAIATRGDSPSPRRYTLDGTRLLGGLRKPGSPADWDRFLAGLRSIGANLAAAHGHGAIRLELACHLSAAYTAGRVFHQASGWAPTIANRGGDCLPATDGTTAAIQGGFDQLAEAGDLLVDIDLIGHDVAARSSELAAKIPGLAGRLSLSRPEEADLTSNEIAILARGVAMQLRRARDALQSRRIHLTMAAPAAFAALLGHHTTALESDMVTYEFDGRGYVPAITLSPGTP